MNIEALKIMTFIDGVNDTPFYDVDNPITLTEYNYSAGRMGMPSLTATLNYKVCLDKFWTKKEYVTFRGEKYFIFNTPSSSKDNTDTRFVHNIQFFPERYVLANTYYYDAVGDGTIDDKYQSNSTKVIFYGNIQEFAQRLNASLEYSKIGYSVVVDEGVSSEEKQISFEDKYIFEVLQEIFNIYELPFYFVGKEIHIGFTSNAVTHPFQYGFNNELLSIKKNNINQQIITRCTAIGSSDNIPFYYPNASDNREEVEASGKKWITPSGNLMPPIYRESEGAERFYNAVNDTYKDPVTGLFYEFENEYTNLNPREGKTTFEYIKPTIKGITNAFGQRIDTVLDVAFDTNDNDEINEETGEYLHPYFFIKLRRFDGEWGFNLFENAITDNNNMTISMTSGQCGACNFEIMVEETIRDGKEVFLNTVQVDDYGNLLRDSDGNVLFGSAKPRQQNTMTNEVWIALKKDIDTYGTIMPSQQQKLTVKPNDSFVILYIELPQAYIDKAENDLKEALIKYMVDNNAEKYNFSINISRIFLAQNPLIAQELNENARIQIIYDEKPIDLYISQYTYNVNEGESLPEITLELQDKITVRTSSIQRAIDAVQQDIMNSIGSIDFLKLGLRYFLRKDVDDIANGKITFKKGVVTNLLQSNNFVAGLLGSGVKLHVDEGGVSHLEIDNIDVRRKATFNELIINQAQYEGGEYIYSRAGIECSAVEDMDGFYRCYFDTKNGQVKNLFKKDDQARSQRFDETSKYYWRLVLSVGNDYIDLSKTDADSGSGIPEVGDNIIQLGNRTDKTRQSAIIVSAKKGGYISILSNISSYDLTDKNFVSFGTDAETGKAYFNLYGDAYIGNRSNTSYLKVKENGLVELKGKLEVGSSGLENFEEWSEKQDQINNAQTSADNAQTSADNAQQAADNAQSTANNAQSAADEAKAAAEKAQTDAATAQSAAESAQATADLAQKETEAINEEIGKINDDNLVSPSEKTALKQQLADIKTEYAEILKQAQKYSVSSTAYTTAYNKALSALNKYTSESETYIPIGADYADISAYYTARQTILEAISTAAKKVADDAQKAADEAMEAAGTAQDTANNAQQTANEALQKAQAAKDYIDNTLPEEIARINRELDGKVENWYYPYTPTLLNEPAKTWIKDGEQEKHVGDMFFNTQTFVDDETTPDAGKAWKWLKNEEGTYYWKLESNSDAVRALQEAAKAKETADRKSQTFVVQPYPPYSVGDLWVEGSKGDIKRCIKSRDTGAFDASDWDKASKYTDDALAQEAKEAAEAAQKDATAAKESARIANEEIGKIKDDGVISPVEKTSLKQQQKDIQSEYNDIIAQATKYSVDKTAYTAAYNAANTALTKYTASSPEYITVGTDFNNIAAYYTARQTILEAISDAAKQYVDDIEQGSRNLIAKKYMMEWNRIRARITDTGSDADGDYYVFDLAALYFYVTGTSENYYNIFPQIKFKENTQYCFKVLWKIQEGAISEGMYFVFRFTDGNLFKALAPTSTELTEMQYITPKGRTLIGISATYGQNTYKSLIYDIQLTEGNKMQNSWLVAPEDAEFTEGVNLISNRAENWKQGAIIETAEKGTTWDGMFYASTKFIRIIKPIAVRDVITISSDAKYTFSIAQLDEQGSYLGFNSYPTLKIGKFTYYLNEACRQIGIIVGKADRSDMTLAELSDVHLQVEQGNVASGFKPSPQDVQGEIDGIDPGTVNLINDRHNIITNTADYPEFTQYSSEVNSKGEREVKIECIKASTSINYRSRYTYLNGYFSEKVYPGFYVFSFDYKSNHDSATVTISVLATGNTNIIEHTTILDNSNEEWKRGYIICDWTGLTNQENVLFFISPKINALGNYVAYRNLKLVRGNRGWDDSSSPSDTANDITNGIHFGVRNLWILKNTRTYSGGYVHDWRTGFSIEKYKITVSSNPKDLVGCRIATSSDKIIVYGKTDLTTLTPYYACKNAEGGIVQSQKNLWLTIENGVFEFALQVPKNTAYVDLGLGLYPYVKPYYLDEIMVVEGTKNVGFNPAPEDVQQNIDDAIDGLNDTINGTFKDGIIEEAEAIAIAKYLNQVNESFDSVAAEYAVVYASPYLTGTPKTALKTAYDALVTKKNTLIEKINTAIQDGKATVAEKTAVDNAFADYNTAMKSYKTAYENAQKAISDKLKTYSDAASQDAADAQQAANAAAQNAATAQAKADAAQSTANTAKANAAAAQQAATAAQSAADAAKEAANAAQTTANDAKTSANAANTELGKINSDGYVSPVEKTSLRQQHSDMKSEYGDIIAQANRYSVSTSAYTTAYNSAIAALSKYTASSPEYITVGSDYANIAAYYTARQTILNSISAAAKKVATDAQSTADTAKQNATNAQNAANQAQQAADTAKQDAADAAQKAEDAQAAADAASTAAKNAADAAQRAEDKASEAATAIAEMNSDTIFDIVEKQAIRTQWEAISGEANTTTTGGANGSYKIAVTQATSAGVSSAALTSAFSALKSQLNTYKLYTNENTPNFSRTTLSQKFSAYYNAERALLKSVADKLVQSTDDKAKEDFAESLGYGSWAEWQEAIGTDKSKTIIENGYIRTSLIKTDTLVAKNVKTAQTGERIEITKQSNAMKAYDSNGFEILSIKGGEFENLPSQVSGFTLPSVMNKLNYTIMAQSYFEESTTFTESFIFGQPCNILYPTAILDFFINAGSFSRLTFHLGFGGQYLHDKIEVNTTVRNARKGAILIPMNAINQDAGSGKNFTMTLGWATSYSETFMNMRIRFSDNASVWYGNTKSEISKDGLLFNNGAAYYQLKRSEKGLELDARNVVMKDRGVLACGTIAPSADADVFPAATFERAKSYIPIQLRNPSTGIYELYGDFPAVMFATAISRETNKIARVSTYSKERIELVLENQSGAKTSGKFDFMIYVP